jgi:hypothetical protein
MLLEALEIHYIILTKAAIIVPPVFVGANKQIAL